MNRMLYLEGKYFLADHNLNYVDKVSMANGVEVRVPMLDRDLVKLAARLPIAYKQRGRIGKWVLRRAMLAWLEAHGCRDGRFIVDDPDGYNPNDSGRA